MFKYFCSKEIQTESQTILACVVSYVLLSISDLLSNIPFLGVIKNSVLGRSGISIILGTLLALLVSSIFCAKWFSKVMVTLFHKTPNDNIWRDVLDLTHGSNLKLYIEYSCAVTPQVRQTGNRLSGLAGTAYASLLT